MRILTDHQEKILQSERQLLTDLRVSLIQFGAVEEDQATLSESLLQLDELFLLVVVGEFNAGKSAIINALLGKSLLQEGVTPTTTHITLLHYGEEELRKVIDRNQQILLLPVEYLKEISIDTGTIHH
jgi:GTP-binding protein EngB required for normal cell division